MDLLLPGLGLLVWTLVAFLLVFFILKKYAWGIIIKSLSERETGIAESLASAQKVIDRFESVYNNAYDEDKKEIDSYFEK